MQVNGSEGTTPASESSVNVRNSDWNPRESPIQIGASSTEIQEITRLLSPRTEVQVDVTPGSGREKPKSPDSALDETKPIVLVRDDPRSAAPAFSEAQIKPLDENTENWSKKIRDTADSILWNTKIASTMLLQLGGLHPWRSNGKWVWVLEPWARRHDDPRQKGYDSGSDIYFKSFTAHKGRLLNLESQGYENPTVTPDGIGGIQLIDHRRINEARNAKKAIVVNVANFQGLPATYN